MILTIYLVVPVDVTVAPPVAFSVIDRSGKAIRGAAVKEIWQHYALERDDHEETLLTDPEGRIALPRRVLRSSPLDRAAGCLKQVAKLFVHASCGRYAKIYVSHNGLTREIEIPGFTVVSDPDPLPTQVVLDEALIE